MRLLIQENNELYLTVNNIGLVNGP